MKELASLVSEKSNDLYIQRMQNIRDLCNAYKNDEEVMIVKVINCHDQSINNHGIRINSDDGNLISSDGDDETVFKGQSQDNNDGASCSNENNTKVDTRRRNFERDYDDHSGTSRVGGDGINLTERSNNMSDDINSSDDDESYNKNNNSNNIIKVKQKKRKKLNVPDLDSSDPSEVEVQNLSMISGISTVYGDNDPVTAEIMNNDDDLITITENNKKSVSSEPPIP
ncbi:Protein of unknown function [Cotesia congregata]|uniref:Uncharacterized protein n=1 Tax=Cotesia congregata TaxID=51543 RepID=A0A8J2H1B1_COTCN|nr:Protein of unknown function [Cotesia congregata]CAG5093274.1 Protein of unknown function [Cotesia congregata]